MTLTAIDPVMLSIFMIVGVLFALAGLWLMLKPKHGGHTAKIELLGMKFESSSAGVLVFLIGAAFVATPLFAPRNAEIADGGTAVQLTATPETTVPAAGVDTRTPTVAAITSTTARAINAVGDEVEPNNNIPEANEITLGSHINGTVSSGENNWDEDWFSFTFPEGYYGEFSANVRGPVWMDVYDSLGRQIDKSFEHTSHSREVSDTRYFVRVGTNDRNATYALTVAAREGN